MYNCIAKPTQLKVPNLTIREVSVSAKNSQKVVDSVPSNAKRSSVTFIKKVDNIVN